MSVAVLSADGASLILGWEGQALPRVLHWGADIGSSAAVLATVAGTSAMPLIPSQSEGWYGRPALAGGRDSAWLPPRFVVTAPLEVQCRPGGGGTITIGAADAEAGLEVHLHLEMTPQGVLRMRHTLTNTVLAPYNLHTLACLLPLPDHATEILDFAGRWGRERSAQRAPLRHGSWVRDNRRGRTGFDAGLLITGTQGFGFQHGQIWAMHTAWSGNHFQYAERLPDRPSVLGGGELLEPGEIRLAKHASYQTPWVYFATATGGLDDLSGRLHTMIRARPHHRQTPRPVTLNTWEAVYFKHDLKQLLQLADTAAAIGVERYVVDDGWFHGRRGATAGLGDWYADAQVWPEGLHPLAQRVRAHGMQFGLWFEPEMVNPDSDLARSHPDWVLNHPGRLPSPSRHQHVLDLARPEVSAYLLERLDALVAEYQLDYIKWDHNRDIAEPVHDGIPGVHAQTLAVYGLLDELRRRHPLLEIESCSSGGARTDLAILERTDRIWGSDMTDPLERQPIQRWTGLLLPPELVGAHVAASPSHQSGRSTELALRCATALFGHAGIEWDITTCTPEELRHLGAWIGHYKRLRPLLHTGRTVRVEHPDPSAFVHGIIAADGSHAIFAYVQLATSATTIPAPMRMPGLAPGGSYTVAVLTELSASDVPWPAWTSQPALAVCGAVLAEIGLPVPGFTSKPGRSFVVELRQE